MGSNEIMEMECGDTTLLIECIDIPLPGESAGTVPSKLGIDSIKKLPQNVFSGIGSLAKHVSEEFHKELDAFDDKPKEIELEFNFGITTKGKILVLTGETEVGVKLKLKWKD